MLCCLALPFYQFLYEIRVLEEEEEEEEQASLPFDFRSSR